MTPREVTRAADVAGQGPGRPGGHQACRAVATKIQPEAAAVVRARLGAGIRVELAGTDIWSSARISPFCDVWPRIISRPRNAERSLAALTDAGLPSSLSLTAPKHEWCSRQARVAFQVGQGAGDRHGRLRSGTRRPRIGSTCMLLTR